jgi:predicted metal-dependent hydrolase
MRQKSARAIVLEPKGKVYDLEKILRELAKKYDLHPRRIKITWSRSRIRKGQQTIRLGSYNHDERLIRVHSSLDQASVPQYFVEYIVYHELLHALVPPENKRGKKDFHPPEYHKLEQKFEHFKEARKFEKYITSHWL